MTKSLLNDIKQITNDYLLQSNSYENSISVSEYILQIIIEIYPKDFVKKYLYIELLEQIVCQMFPYINNIYKFKLTDKSTNRLKKTVSELKLIKLPEQRSAEWYTSRKHRIGASELASVFNKNPFCSRKKFIEKKSYPSLNPSPMVSNIYCQHGIIFEEVILQLYCLRTNYIVSEFGSIPDRKHTFLAASPDGISNNGIMLEIKCPLKRKTYGLPPIYYWYQMQQQLKVCKLNQCDYIECKIEVYNNWQEYCEDTIDNQTINKCGLEKGVLIEYHASGTTDYIYPPKLLMNINEIYTWTYEMKLKLNNENKIFSRLILWKLVEYHVFSVYRNKLWWKYNIKEIEDLWNTVLSNRTKDPPIKLDKQNKKQPKSFKPQVYMFLSDSDID